MKDKLISLNRETKSVLAQMQTRPEFRGFSDFLAIQKNNIAVLEWFRIKSNDPDIREKKARFDGMVEMIDLIIAAFKASKKGEE